MRSFSTKDVAICGVLITLALALSYSERFLNLQLFIPLPGVKLGLANIVSVVAIYFLGNKLGFTVMIIRCLLGSFFGGGVTGLIFSLTGGIFAFFSMTITKRIKYISIYGVSMVGAAAHQVGQILSAVIIMQTTSIVSYLPILLCVSVFTGALNGSISASVLKGLERSSYYKQ